MAYCYCCIYGQIVEIGKYNCVHSDTDSNDRERSDVSDCLDYIYDDQFDESEDGGDICYLKDICYEKYCERFNK